MSFWTDWPRGLRISSRKEISRDIRGRKILRLERKGKAVLVHLSGGKILGFHQRMSGKLLVVPKKFSDKHIHFHLDISRYESLVMHDIRKFGVVWYGSAEDILKDKYLARLGADPLSLSFEEFMELLKTRKGIIKPLLLRQDVFSGIGNIVADEVLWKAKIHPKRKIQNLEIRELKNLFSALKFVLKKSIRLGGTTMRDWLHPDSSEGRYYQARFVYQRAGEKCQRCNAIIRRIKVASRGTFICPKCQKLR